MMEIIEVLDKTQFNMYKQFTYRPQGMGMIAFIASNNIIFYEQSESFIDSKSNHNLGWSLGFRNSIYNELDFTAEALVDINGPKYFNL